MQGDFNFIPKILLCGDEPEFFLRVGNRPFKIVGKAQIIGEVDWGGVIISLISPKTVNSF